MLTEEFVELANKICKQKAEEQTIELKSAQTGCPMICVAEIPSIDIAERPCYYRGAGRTKGSYIRVGDADLPMTDYELYSYEAFRKHLHDDERPVERATLQLLDMEKMRVDRPGFSRLTQEQTMELPNVKLSSWKRFTTKRTQRKTHSPRNLLKIYWHSAMNQKPGRKSQHSWA